MDYEALVLSALDAASSAKNIADRKRHLDQAAVHATNGEKARHGKVTKANKGDD